jgi:hypothetical protein
MSDLGISRSLMGVVNVTLMKLLIAVGLAASGGMTAVTEAH